MSLGLIITEVFRQVRRDTLRILEASEPQWLTFAPRGTSNHILWHCGHAVWVQDEITRFLLSGDTALPADWNLKFGMNCHPVAETQHWPQRSELVLALTTQQDQLIAQLTQVTDERLLDVADASRGTSTVAERIIHACHDEAKHSGEMYLLLKLCQAPV